jgi:hypothetical protein
MTSGAAAATEATRASLFRTSDICPPLVGGDRRLQAHLEAAIDAAAREAAVSSVEVRGAPASDSAVAVDAGLRHTLQLDRDPEAVYRRFKPKQVRHAIRTRSGVVSLFLRLSGKELCRTFYALQTATRRRLGVPVQPRRYFSFLWRRIVEPGLGFVLGRTNGRETCRGRSLPRLVGRCRLQVQRV